MSRAAKAARRARATTVAPAAPKPSLSLPAIREAIAASQAAAQERRRNPGHSPFQVAQHPPKATPDKSVAMAMDESLNWATTQWGSAFGGIASEGLLFLGYPYLAELAQRPEYRIFAETIADDATRQWIDFQVTGDEEENRRRAEKDPEGEAERAADPDERKKKIKAADKTDKVKALQDDQARLEVRDRFYAISRDDGFFGRSQVYLDFGTDLDGDADELKTPIGNGRDETTLAKVKGKTLRSLKVIEPVWVYPTTYNANNPLRHDWYNPQVWYVMGREIHVSRMPWFVGHPVPDMLKPAYSFGGLSMSQMAKPYVDIWLTTRQSVAEMIHSFSVMVLQTNMQSLLEPGGAQLALLRAQLFNEFRDNQGLFLTDKNTEEFKNISAPLGGLHELQAQAQEHMCVAKGTLIETDRGQVPIEKVSRNDRVMTRNGFAPIEWVGITGEASRFVQVETDESVLRVTECHPIWSARTNGFVSARNVERSHRLLKSTNWENTGRLSLGAVAGGGRRKAAITAITRQAASFIARFMRPTSATSPAGSTFTTWMKTLSTTLSRTLSASLIPTTWGCIPESGGRNVLFLTPRNPASDAAGSLRRSFRTVPSTAPVRANTRPTGCESSKVTRVTRIECQPEAVYNLSVAEGFEPEFYANGILTHNCSVARIPLVKFTGISPAGLNASSEGEIAVYDDTIAAYQNRVFRPNLTKIINFEQVALWGEVDPQITYVFNPLRVMTEKEKGEKQKAEAERDNIYVSMGALAPEEVRSRVIDDPDLPYADLDPDDVPDLAEEEDEGLMPGGKQPGETGAEGGGANDAVLPFALASDAGWSEGDHPRGQPGNAGQFGPGGGGGKGTPHAPQFGLQHGVFTAGGGGGSKPAKSNMGAPLALSGLKKVGGQKGSNPGGVFEDGEGKRFYVKQGKTPDHVRNEMIAASLYDLAGTPTLKYRPVEGGGHVAAEMAKLDKDNAGKLSTTERREAARDFAVHAWLGNWDAVGLGGDNLGTVAGVPTALDLGGALEYRAQGSPKGKAFGTSVGELDTLRNGTNKDAAGIFGPMTPGEMRESARFVTDIPDSAIKSAVAKAGGSAALADKLIARKQDIASRARFFGAEGDPKKPGSTVVIPAGESTPVKELNGVKFEAWNPPDDWAAVDGQIELEEPELVVAKGKQAATGVVIREPDGRVWMVQPKGGYGGYEATFPKGRLEKGLSMQANAIKEAYEESGLKVRIVGHAGDHDGDLTTTRYYLAEREGGDPSKHDDETEGVVLAPKDKAGGFLNRKRDRSVLGMDAWEESKHPRGEGGKFAETAGGGGSGEAPTTYESFVSKSDEMIHGGFAHGTVDLVKNHPEWAAKLSKEDPQAGGEIAVAQEAIAKGGSAAPKFGSKKEHVAHLLTQGTTTEEILKATGWPSVSVPAMAKAAGLKLEKYKEGGVTKYKGTLMTPEEKAAAKAEAIAKSKPEAAKAGIAPAQAAVIQKAAEITGKPFAEVAKAAPKFPKATPAELEKAKKSIPLQLQYMPGAPQTPEAQKLVDKFNEKYANKTLTPHLTPGALEQKVQDFKQLQADMVPLMTAQQQAQVKAQAEAQAKAAAQAQAQKLKEAAAAKEAAEKNKAVMAELGINDQEAVGFVALAKMMGGSQENLVANFKKYEQEAAKYGYPISGFQCALIKNYSNGGYGAVNEALRKGSITEAQHVYTKMVNKALAGMPRHTGMLNRGTTLTAEQQALYIAGNVVEERAFTSSSTGGGFGGNTSYKIKAIGKRGASIKQLSNHSSENEVLFAARTFFKVTKVEGKPGGNMVVHMEEMDD